MWQQNYFPVANSLAWSTLVAAAPIFALLLLLGVLRKPAWMASLVGLGVAAVVAGGAYGMPVGPLVSAIGYGAAFGLFPIGYVVFAAILLYRITLESGLFEVLKDSIGHLTSDRRLQALLIAFAFGAFVEGAAGFGTPVAVAAAMLVGLGFEAFEAAGICLLANTAPVSFGSIGIPVATLAVITGLPLARLSAGVGRLCAPTALFLPAYIVWVMSGRKGLREVLPVAATCGVAFGVVQFVVSNFIGPQLTNILASMAGMLVVFLFCHGKRNRGQMAHSGRRVMLAWTPYALLVVFILTWGFLQSVLNRYSIVIQWPGLHNAVERMPPVVAHPTGYAAVYNFSWLSAAGTACLLAAVVSALVVGLTPRQMWNVLAHTSRQLALAELTLAAVLALAFLMNYSGSTATLGLAFATTGVMFPFFSAMLGWVGVFLTGSDTSANALFGGLQVVTATKLGMNPVLMAAANSSGGAMGKMISLTSIAVAAAVTGMPPKDEARLFRFSLKHAVLLCAVIGLLTMFFAYVATGWAP